jgi:hypothetical protein
MGNLRCFSIVCHQHPGGDMDKVNRRCQNKKGVVSKVLFSISLLFLMLALYLLAWVVLPAPKDFNRITIPEGPLAGSPLGTALTSPTDYELTLSWMRWLRVGQVGTLELTLREASNADSSLGRQDVIAVIVEPAFSNLSIKPSGRIQANLAPGQSLGLSWDAEGQVEGDYAGKVYISFGFFDENANEQAEIPVAVVDLNIQVKALWGLATNLVLWLGLVGVAFWGILFIIGYWYSKKHAY